MHLELTIATETALNAAITEAEELAATMEAMGTDFGTDMALSLAGDLIQVQVRIEEIRTDLALLRRADLGSLLGI